jgi:glycosyl hydrolase family 2
MRFSIRSWALPAVLLFALYACKSAENELPVEFGSAGSGGRVTPWTEAGYRRVPLPEYPRPSLVRDRWLNLNGVWQFEVGGASQPPPFDRDLGRKIRVPYAVESSLSGIEEHHEHLWYKRTFDVPTGWRGDRVWLRFGAVDWEAEVWVNGRNLGVHRGGYDPFAIDITDALLAIPAQELLLRVFDPTDEGEQMRGKQALKPGGIWYTPVSGIWQTVWIEPVPRRGIEDLVVEPDLEAGTVAVTAVGQDLLGDDMVEVELLERGGLLAARRGAVGERLVVPIPAPRAWSPEDPFLYDLRVTRSAGDGRAREQVTSYFGLRTIERVIGEDGQVHLELNGEQRFLMGVLDQGWWPDGLYTAPSDEALQNDVTLAKSLGFDLIRKHVKVEPERWYHWCDRLGVLVLQDIPNGGNRTEAGREQFEAEMARLVAARGRHPSIIGWVLFNEGWGQYDTGRLTRELQGLDPTRLVTGASGWVDVEAGDMIDVHHYPGPRAPQASASRLAVLGEFGGVSWPVPGHDARSEAWGYQATEDSEQLAFAYEGHLRDMWTLVDAGLDLAVYTQLTDVETETNGLVTYDREVIKVPAERIAAANRCQMRPLRTVSPTAELGGRSWRYSVDRPEGDWILKYGESLDLPGKDHGWVEGLSGFGVAGTPGAVVRTDWSSGDLWLVTDFELGSVPAGDLLLRLHHDEQVKVWINGTLVLSREGFTTSYTRVDTGLRAEDVLVAGENHIAVHVRNSGGGQYVDVGVEVLGD